MEITSKPQETPKPSPVNSPNRNVSCTNSNNIGSPLLQVPICRSEINSNSTTFVQADAQSFKKVVQMLTGSSETANQASKSTTLNIDQQNTSSTKGSIPPIKSGHKKQGFKLYERRNSLNNGFRISPLIPNGGSVRNSSFSPRKPELLSPSILDFPALVLSPVTPLNENSFVNKSPSSIGSSSSSEEEKAIAKKEFYLHPSPRNTTPRGFDPQLLPLFPLTSPRISGSSSS